MRFLAPGHTLIGALKDGCPDTYPKVRRPQAQWCGARYASHAVGGAGQRRLVGGATRRTHALDAEICLLYAPLMVSIFLLRSAGPTIALANAVGLMRASQLGRQAQANSLQPTMVPQALLNVLAARRPSDMRCLRRMPGCPVGPTDQVGHGLHHMVDPVAPPLQVQATVFLAHPGCPVSCVAQGASNVQATVHRPSVHTPLVVLQGVPVHNLRERLRQRPPAALRIRQDLVDVARLGCDFTRCVAWLWHPKVWRV